MRTVLLNAKTAAATSDAIESYEHSEDYTCQATVTGTGAVTATVIVEGSNESATGNFLTIATITLSGTTTASDGFVATSSWQFTRARLTAISGTGAAVTVTMGS